jgi:Secretion system C-terminal sorting domain
MKQMPLSIRLTFLGLFMLGIGTAQTVTYTVTGGNCAGTFILTLSGTKNGKNTYSGSILGNTATISWSGTQWEINTPFGIQFTSSSSTALDPPCHNIGVFASAGVCLGGTITNSSGDCATTIPVELMSFAASPQPNAVELTWLTASETNNKGFDIERSEDGLHFTAIEFVKSKGDSKTFTTYQLMDKNAAVNTTIYYRLRQIDLNGKESFSNIISVKSVNKMPFSFFPNPASFHITINSYKKISNCLIFDFQGQLVLSPFIIKENTQHRIDISSLKTGHYILQIEENGAIIREKFIKM